MEHITIIDGDKRAKINKRKKEAKFVAVDVETTGLSPLYNELIEVSAIKYEGAKKIDTFSTLIKPKKEIIATIMPSSNTLYFISISLFFCRFVEYP